MNKASSVVGFCLVFIFISFCLNAATYSSILLENSKQPLTASQSGFIRFHVTEGEWVKENQMLFEIGSYQLKLEYAAAKLKYDKSLLELQKLGQPRTQKEIELEALRFRQKEQLFEAGAISKDAFTIARYEYELKIQPPREEDLTIAQIDVEEKKLNLERIQYQMEASSRSAPIDGQIIKIYYLNRQWVQVGQKIMDILSIHPLKIILQSDLKALSQLTRNQKVGIKIDTGSGTTETEGILTFINSEHDSVDQAVKLIVIVQNKAQLFRPGMRVSVDLP